MERMKTFSNILKKCLLIFAIILILISIINRFILKLYHLQFRQWVYETIIFILLLFVAIYIIQLFIKLSKKVKLIICGIIVSFVILSLIFIKWTSFILFCLLLITPDSTTEHVVEREGVKYVAIVDSRFLSTEVYFHDYKNFLVMGDEIKFQEYYKGSYDPIEREKENYNNVENKKEDYEKEKTENSETNKDNTSNSKQTDNYVVNSNDILYEESFGTNTKIRIINVGSILGGRMLIVMQKSKDGGKTWSKQINSSDGSMTVNNEAKFIFMSEEVGFINNASLFILGKDNDALLVTIDGGRNFKNANFIFPLNIEHTNFYVSNLPYMENGKLKVKLYSPVSKYNEQSTYYEFQSIDNGLNWSYIE